MPTEAVQSTYLKGTMSNDDGGEVSGVMCRNMSIEDERSTRFVTTMAIPTTPMNQYPSYDASRDLTMKDSGQHLPPRSNARRLKLVPRADLF